MVNIKKVSIRSIGIISSLLLMATSFYLFPQSVYAISLNVVPPEGRINDNITITGGEFPANTQLSVRFQDNFLGVAFTNSAGQFKLNAVVPSGYQSGMKTITASTFGGTSRAFQFNLLPAYLEISPKEAQIDDKIELQGYGCNSGASAMVFLDSKSVQKTTTTMNGTYQASFVLPETPAGEHEVKIVDSLGHDSSPAKLIVKPNFQVSEPLQGKYGSSIPISGTGFAAYSDIKATFEDTPETAGGWSWFSKTNALGSFPIGNALIGEGTGGEHKIKVIDSKGNKGPSQATFRMLPILALVEPRSGSIGSKITVQGKGFRAGESNILLFLGKEKVGTTSANDLGSFSFNGQIPEITSGSWMITANNDISFPYNFKTEPSVILEPSNGLAGTKVTIKGMGFISGTSNINIRYDDTVVSIVPPLQSNDKGSFSGNFTVPDGYWGSHTVTVNDGKNEKTATWVLEKPTPPPPTIIPQDGPQVTLIIPVTVLVCAGIIFSVIYFTRRPKSKEEKEQSVIRKQLRKEQKQKQKEEKQRITDQILVLAEQNRGGVTIESVVSICSIDFNTAEKYLKKLKAHKDGDWYFVPEIEETYK